MIISSLFFTTYGDETLSSMTQNTLYFIMRLVTLKNMGINVTSLNNAPIKLDALEISNIYGSSADVSG